MQVDTFNEIVDPSGQSDEDSYKALTALGILAAIQSLVKATFNETQVSSMACLKNCILGYFCGWKIFFCMFLNFLALKHEVNIVGDKVCTKGDVSMSSIV